MRLHAAWVVFLWMTPVALAQEPPAEKKIARSGAKKVQRPYSLLKPSATFQIGGTAVNAGSNKVMKQWVGPGGDSMRFGHDSLWITDYHRGWLRRIPLKDLTKN